MVASTGRWLATVAVAVLGAALGACDHGGTSRAGALEVHWQIKGNRCAQAGVTTVQVSVLYGDGAVAAQTAACEDGQVVFDALDGAAYTVQVDGLEADGSPAYSATASDVRVGGDEPTAVTLELIHIGSGLSLSWYFANSGLCSFNGVAQVDVTVRYDDLELFHQVYGCDPFADATLPPPADGVLGIVVADLQVPEARVVLFGLDREGVRRFSGDKTIQLHEGRVVSVSVELTECEGPCS